MAKINATTVIAELGHNAVTDHSNANRAGQQKLERKKALRAEHKQKIATAEAELDRMKQVSENLEGTRPELWEIAVPSAVATAAPLVGVLFGPLAGMLAGPMACQALHMKRTIETQIEHATKSGYDKPSEALTAAEWFIPFGCALTDGARHAIVHTDIGSNISQINEGDMVEEQATIKSAQAEVRGLRSSMQDDLDDMKASLQRQTRRLGDVDNSFDKRAVYERRVSKGIRG